MVLNRVSQHTAAALAAPRNSLGLVSCLNPTLICILKPHLCSYLQLVTTTCGLVIAQLVHKSSAGLNDRIRFAAPLAFPESQDPPLSRCILSISHSDCRSRAVSIGLSHGAH